MDKMLGALSLCKKAGALTVGFDAVCEKLEKKEAKVLFFAKDLSDKTQKRVLAQAGETPAHVLALTQDELSEITRRPAGVLAVTNQDLTALCLAKMTAEEETD